MKKLHSYLIEADSTNKKSDKKKDRTQKFTFKRNGQKITVRKKQQDDGSYKYEKKVGNGDFQKTTEVDFNTAKKVNTPQTKKSDKKTSKPATSSTSKSTKSKKDDDATNPIIDYFNKSKNSENDNTDTSNAVKVFKKMKPGILRICAVCCSIVSLPVGAIVGLGSLIAMAVQACKERGNEDAEKLIIQDAKRAANSVGIKSIIKDVDGIEKSAINKDGKSTSAKDFVKNLEKNKVTGAKEAIEKNEKIIKNVDSKELTKVTEKALKAESKEKETEEKDEYTYKDKDGKEITVKREKQEDDSYKYMKKVGDGEFEETKEEDFKSAKDSQIEPKTEPKEKEEKLTNEQIEELQEELSNLDPEKDKDKVNEITDKLKKAAKDNGKDESEYIIKIDNDKDGKPRQHKTGPRGGRYYRVKGNDGWGPWNSAVNEFNNLSTFLKYRTVYS